MDSQGSATFDSLNPHTGEVIGTYQDFCAPQVHAVVAAAQVAAPLWAGLGFRGRAKVLLNWSSLITARIDEIAELIANETGKPISDATLEVSFAISHISWAAKNAAKVLLHQHRPSGLLTLNMRGHVERSPYGVVGVIGPWNYPIFTPMGSIAYALAAGNTVVFKPSEFVPGVGAWLADTFAEVSPLPDVLTTVTGLPDTGRALTESAIDKLAFTGSTRTAKKVAASCAARMIPVILECGGKDPVIVDQDANVELAAESALWSAMANAGQSCLGAERVYVHEKVADRFIEVITKLAQNVQPGQGKNYGPATMPSQLQVIQTHLDDAKRAGAKFLVGDVDAIKGPYVDPVIMVDLPEDSIAMTEETFGPTLAINRVKSMDEAVALSNASRYGLSASIWSKKNGRAIASKMHCGMVSINSVFYFVGMAALPFGGVKESGYGRIHGPEGLLEFVYVRTVVEPRFRSPIKLTSFTRTATADRLVVKAITVLHGKKRDRRKK